MKQLFSILAFILLQHTLFAQCPIAAGCVPANAPASNYVFGMGIFNVSLGSISYTTSGVQDGYRDYSCTQSTQLVAGNSYPVSVTTNPNANENVRLWIDYNNNGNFEASELAFSSDNKKQHTGTVTVPLTAVQNQSLRLRVSADYIAAPIPTPCSAAQYSQAEDYAVTVVVPTNPPVAAFTVSDTLTCTGSVSFTDQSANSPATWHWDFGDGTTSALRNPSHSYANTGTYSVSLKVCNSLGCDSLLQTNLVRYHNNVPVAAACTPATASYCCKHGILGVEFGSINITSANATAGYEDFTCRQTATFIENNPYQLKIKTDSTTQQDIKVFIDLNNDGQFNLPQEEVVSLSSVINPQLLYRIPTGAVLNTPLRMRVAADFVGSSFTACSGIQNGQAEDYTIIIAANTNKPNAQFVTSHRTGCDSLVQFTDQSINSPTSWHWDFGDGTSSNQQHPQHLYTQPGLYQVRLITCNSFGCDTAFVSNPLAMAIPCRQYCSSKNHINKVNWIKKVKLGSIDNISGQDSIGYGNYTNIGTYIAPGASVPFTVEINYFSGTVPSSLGIWIDSNGNGTFEASEMLYSGLQRPKPSPLFIYQDTLRFPSQVQTLYTTIRIQGDVYGVSKPCFDNKPGAEVEDYTIFFGQPSAIDEELRPSPITVYPNPAQTDVSIQVPAPSDYKLLLCNSIGKVVLEEQLSQVEKNIDLPLNRQLLKPGLYFLQLTDKRTQQRYFKKLVIE